LAEHACHRRAVGATRQEGADALVAGDLFGDAVAESVAEGVTRRGEGLPVLLVEKQRPVAGLVHTISVDQHACAAGNRRTWRKTVRGAGIMWKYR
jgi:hypothetical protein